MRDIFRAEWLRYRLHAVLFATAHLLLLAFFMRLADLGQQPLNVYRLTGGCYAIVGILLGMHQTGTWRRPNQWLNLLHRPVPPKHIALGLLCAGSLALCLAIVVPVGMALAWQAWGTARVVDTRHLLVPLAAGLLATGGYLAGVYGMLADRRYSACGLVLIAWMAMAQASGAAFVVVQCMACAWLLVMVLGAFRPDPGAPPHAVLQSVVTAVPLMMGVYLLLVLLGFIGELAWIMQGSHPVNMATPPAGGYVETERMSGRDRMLAGMAGSRLPEASLWREQTGLSDVHTMDRQLGDVPVRQSMSNGASTSFDDEEQRIHWTFSHDDMRFEGIHMTDGRAAGLLGVGANGRPFEDIATPEGTLPGMQKGDVALMAGDTLFQYVSASRAIVPRLRVAPGETLLGTTPVGGSLVAISDRAIYVFDGRHLVEGEAPVAARQRVAIPGASGDLARAELVELVDGYLLSFTFSRHAYDLLGTAPRQSILRVTDAGVVTVVATRALGADFPAFYRYRTWWASPAMYALSDGVLAWSGHPGPYATYATPPVPRASILLAASLALLSLLAGAWLVSRRDLPLSRRVAWTLCCAVVGVPGLVCLALMVPRSERYVATRFRTAHA